MKAILSVIDSVSQWSGKAFSFLWLVVVALVSLEVILRYGFDAPTLWGHETMLHLAGTVYLIGGAYTLYHQGHVLVDVVYKSLSPRLKAIVDLITFPVFFLFVLVLLWGGGARAWSAVMIREGSGSPWNPPVYPLLLTIPLGAFLILLQGLAKFIRDFTLVINPGKR
jgi:TRAP-type mannitol/chloroaromatic compound transport system permease small subunit